MGTELQPAGRCTGQGHTDKQAAGNEGEEAEDRGQATDEK